MAETSGLGGTYGGWTPSGTPHYSGYASRGMYRSRSMPGRYAALYMLAAPIIGVTATYGAAYLPRGASMAAKYARSRYAFKVAPRTAARTTVAGYLGRKVSDFVKKRIKKKVRKEAIGFAWEYAKDKYNYYQERFERQTRQDLSSSRRRRRIQYEYAYKY